MDGKIFGVAESGFYDSGYYPYRPVVSLKIHFLWIERV